MRARTASRGSCRPASIMPSMAAFTASDFMRMKSVSVLSRSKTIARIKQFDPGSFARGHDGAAQTDLAVVDAKIETARRVVAHPRLVRDRRAVATVVGERQQHAFVALHALGKAHFHPRPLPWSRPAERAGGAVPALEWAND